MNAAGKRVNNFKKVRLFVIVGIQKRDKRRTNNNIRFNSYHKETINEKIMLILIELQFLEFVLKIDI